MAGAQQLIKDAAERENIARGGGGLVASLLRRRVPEGSAKRPEQAELAGTAGGAIAARQPETEHFDVAVRTQDQVFRLDIAVYDALRMGGGERAGDLAAPADYFAPRLRSSALFAEWAAFDKLHGDGCLAVFPDDVVDGNDVGVIHGGGRLSFLYQAFASGAAGDELDRQNAAQLGIAGRVDAACDGASDFVTADSGTRMCFRLEFKRIESLIGDVSVLLERRIHKRALLARLAESR